LRLTTIRGTRNAFLILKKVREAPLAILYRPGLKVLDIKIGHLCPMLGVYVETGDKIPFLIYLSINCLKNTLILKCKRIFQNIPLKWHKTKCVVPENIHTSTKGGNLVCSPFPPCFSIKIGPLRLAPPPPQNFHEDDDIMNLNSGVWSST